ncbi:MAG: P-II family nitrogen regulator [Solirubrobacteraceae bacterium]|nr:P-II family nitrogen regulator [Solirubrobacteraceae bacterium]
MTKALVAGARRPIGDRGRHHAEDVEAHGPRGGQRGGDVRQLRLEHRAAARLQVVRLAKLHDARPRPCFPGRLDAVGHRFRVALDERHLMAVASQHRAGGEAADPGAQNDDPHGEPTLRRPAGVSQPAPRRARRATRSSVAARSLYRWAIDVGRSLSQGTKTRHGPAASLQPMKLVIGIVRPDKANDVLEALYRAEVRGISMSRVQGHGGELERVETYRGTRVQMGLSEKVRFEIAVSDEFVQTTIDALCEGGQTGEVGDGKIFVVPLERAVRIRTGEKDHGAVTPVGK